MRLLLCLCLLGCAKGRYDSLVLSGRVADDPGGGAAVCSWAFEEVEVTADEVFVDGRGYPVDSDSAASHFLRLLEPCERAEAVAAFRAWRAAEDEAREASRGKRTTIQAAAVPSDYDLKPRHERQPEEAWVEEARRSPAGGVPSASLLHAREAFVTALQAPASSAPD